jgi:undecaprenyl-diphosphatase
VSSLGHAVLLPKLLGWSINEKAAYWLAFLVALHLGTATALLIYFRDEWVAVARAFVRSVQTGQMGGDHDERLAWMVVLGTIPAGVVGFALQNPLRSLFASPSSAAIFLIVNGTIMIAGECLLQRQLSQRMVVAESIPVTASHAGSSGLTRDESAPYTADTDPGYRDITQLSWRDAAIVGFAQVGSLLPGISRSGVTMVAGLVAGLTHEAAARYAFLLATPIIGAAGVLEIPQLFDSSGRSVLGDALVGMVLAGIAAYLSVRFLMRYFETGRLYPFAFYSCTVGVGSLLWLTLH